MRAEYKNITPADPGCIRVVQITDPHVFGTAGRQFKGTDTAMSLQRVISMVMEDVDTPDLILVTGDLVQDPVPEAYQNLRNILQTADLPVFCLPGNHDRPAMMDDLLNTGSLSTCKSVSCGVWEFCLLDSVLEDNEKGLLNAAELEFLQARLAASPAQHIVICLHHHPLPIGSPWMDEMMVENGAELLQLVRDKAQVRCVLWGHIHQEYTAQLGHILMLGSPSTCIQFKPETQVFETDVLPPGYRKFRFYRDGRIDSSVHWLDTSGTQPYEAQH